MDLTCNFVGKVLQISSFAARFCPAYKDSCAEELAAHALASDPCITVDPELERSRG